MATAFNIPSEIEVKSYLMMLYDGSEIATGSPVDAAAPGSVIGAYINDDNEPVAACVCDIEFAAFGGCSLTMLPPGVAEDAVKDKKLEPAMLDNLNEVMNIFSRFFMNDKTPHLRLDKCYSFDEAPEGFKEVIANATDRADMEIEIPRYGKGNLSILAI